jgi:hypothetical protein
MKTLEVTGSKQLAALIGDAWNWYPNECMSPQDAKPGSWEESNPRIVFLESSSLPLDVLRKLPNYNFSVGGIIYDLVSFETETYNEYGSGWPGDNGTSTYARIKITFAPKGTSLSW